MRPFYINTWQCYNCNRFGHNASDCRAKVRCLLCAGQHKHTDCPKRDGSGKVLVMRCSNCSGSHAANYGGCPNIKAAKLAEKIRSEEKISYRDAFQKSIKNVQTSSVNASSYSSIVQNKPYTIPVDAAQSGASTSVSTSVDPAPIIAPPCNKCLDQNELIKGIAIMITKLFYERDNCTDFSKNVSEIIKNVLNFYIPPETLCPSAKRRHTEEDNSSQDLDDLISPSNTKKKKKNNKPNSRGRGSFALH